MYRKAIKPFRIGRRTLALLGLLAALAAVSVFSAVPLRVQHVLQRGRTALRQRDLGAAFAAFRLAESLDAERAETHFWLARAYRLAGQFDEARARLDQARRLGFPVERVQNELRLAMAQAGRLEEVEPYLSEMLAEYEADGPEICDAFVNGYCLNLHFNAAEQLLDAWQADYPRDAQVPFRRGLMFASTENWPQAVEALQDAHRLAPQRIDVQRALAHALLKQNEPRKAESLFRQVLTHEPNDPRALRGWGDSLRSLGRPTEAREAYKRVLELDPHHCEARFQLAGLALAEKRPDESVRWLEPLVSAWPEDIQSRYLLGRAFQELGEAEAADEHLRIAERLDSQRDRIEALGQQVNDHPRDAELRFELGMLLLRHTSREEGANWLRSVLQLAPGHRGAHLGLAEYYAKRQETRMSQTHVRLAQGDTRRTAVPAPHGSLAP